MMDDYLDFHGERPRDAVPYPDLRGPAPNSTQTPPTPRPGPPRLGRPAAGYASPSLVSADAAPNDPASFASPRSRAPPATVTAERTTPSPRRRRSSRTTAATGEDDDGPASMPESARQELYELYQFSSDGSRAQRHESPSGSGSSSTEVDSLESELQQLNLPPFQLGAIVVPLSRSSRYHPDDDDDQEEEEEHEVSYEEEVVEEEVVAEEVVAAGWVEPHVQQCEDPEAEAAERERDLLEHGRRHRLGGPVGR